MNSDERNSGEYHYPVIGINRDKTFMPTVRKIDGGYIGSIKWSLKGMFSYLVGCDWGEYIFGFRIGLYDNEPTGF